MRAQSTTEGEKLFSVRLPESLTHTLKIHAATTRRSVKDLVREAITAALKAEGVKC